MVKGKRGLRKMDKKIVINALYKNRILLMLCAVLIIGGVFGISVLKIIPENICKNLFIMTSKTTENFLNEFLNKFSLSAVFLILIYSAGLSIIGKYTSVFFVFAYGIFNTFASGLNYMFFGSQNFVNSVISYFTSALYFGFMLIIMAENSFYSSLALNEAVKNNNAEKARFKAKNLTVKFIGFTAVFAIFSAFSAYISIVIQSVL